MWNLLIAVFMGGLSREEERYDRALVGRGWYFSGGLFLTVRKYIGPAAGAQTAGGGPYSGSFLIRGRLNRGSASRCAQTAACDDATVTRMRKRAIMTAHIATLSGRGPTRSAVRARGRRRSISTNRGVRPVAPRAARGGRAGSTSMARGAGGGAKRFSGRPVIVTVRRARGGAGGWSSSTRSAPARALGMAHSSFRACGVSWRASAERAALRPAASLAAGRRDVSPQQLGSPASRDGRE